MTTIKTSYLGNLRTAPKHLQSGTDIITDAPVDNNGKGEAFSPTDLIAAALGSCMATIMGIVAQKDNFEISGLVWETTKIMSSNPRKIEEIIIDFTWDGAPDDEKMLQKLKNAARTCPVALSLSADLKQTINFNF